MKDKKKVPVVQTVCLTYRLAKSTSVTFPEDCVHRGECDFVK